MRWRQLASGSPLHHGQKTQFPPALPQPNVCLCEQAIKGYTEPMTDITPLEEQIAYLTRTVEELSDVVARQEKELSIAQKRIAMLMEREAGRELEAGGTVPLADQKPPHW